MKGHDELRGRRRVSRSCRCGWRLPTVSFGADSPEVAEAVTQLAIGMECPGCRRMFGHGLT